DDLGSAALDSQAVRVLLRLENPGRRDRRADAGFLQLADRGLVVLAELEIQDRGIEGLLLDPAALPRVHEIGDLRFFAEENVEPRSGGRGSSLGARCPGGREPL